ncbi:phosphoserine phosphatase SerB [Arcobacter nitrofigilis DSM 7299]|jgi:phosphoserine phosphatase|uniref:Phosphoserine phosphatase n=1 Tax=Arcobacter nitrofigilis (strain ATCC 33309 / DSM 7299 / CCUG 15893 / LMG 7604 / NCTC 12251 / CI) TaxID=572480 RepID=D5V786_ARCNC|nr:phosphoserine phosphatase SerB [Arcobacter nitrofigilis]ADG94506.1 phosphoserine phosphatase SerB [Arcobacter nitrofigilis DSM 7299]
MKLAVFDFDSTLMDGETIDFLAKPLGLEEKVAKITEEAMAGRLDFFESLIERVALLKGLENSLAVDICKSLPLMPGAMETVAKLKEKGYKVVCFSGGFRIGTTPAKEKLGLDADFSNILHHKNGILTGLVGGDMMFGFSKGDMIQRVQAMLGVSKENTLVAGDGANDVSMFPYADKRVAFCAKDILKKEANIIVDTKDLTQILEHI